MALATCHYVLLSNRLRKKSEGAIVIPVIISLQSYRLWVKEYDTQIWVSHATSGQYKQQHIKATEGKGVFILVMQKYCNELLFSVEKLLINGSNLVI